MPKTKTIAEREAEARKHSVLLKSAYFHRIIKFGLRPKDHPNVRPELLAIFKDLVAIAAKYKKLTGHHVPFLGELGEIFAEIVFDIKRHAPRTRGSDGKLGNDFVEVKTITPNKKSDTVQVKRSGNFGKLVVVKISDDFQFGARMVDRKFLKKGNDKFARISWDSMIAGEPHQETHRIFPIKFPSGGTAR